MPEQNPISKPLLAAIGIDAALVLVFVLIGRGSHAEAYSPVGILTTLWPFWLGLALGHVIVYRWHRPFAVNWTGIVLWASTVVFGTLFRAVSGQGLAVSFVIVTALVLGVFLLGWRALYQRFRVRRAKQRAKQQQR
jgi:hypothetical protein